MVQSSSETSPAKWHLAHTTWFFETFLLREFLAGYREFDAQFHWLFNSYYNAVSPSRRKSSAVDSRVRRSRRSGPTAAMWTKECSGSWDRILPSRLCAEPLWA